MIILEPNWLTTNLMAPIFAPPDFKADYEGLDFKEHFSHDDLKRHFKNVEPTFLVQLLVHFELAYE